MTVSDWQLIIDWRALGATQRELLIGELWCHAIYGIEERDDVAVVGFATEVAARAAAAAVRATSRVPSTIVELVEDTYLDEWRSFARPWQVSGLFVRPSWVDGVAPPDTIEIVIDPQRSFGSGAHASTRLTLEMMQRLDLTGCTVLDAGCGSGVLSVAAAVLGAARVDAIDIEPEAVAATLANARRNGVGDRVHARVATVGGVAEAFDIVLANVLPSVHREIAGDLCSRAWRFAIVAGMLDGQVEEVESAYRATRVALLREGEWIALCLEIDRADIGA